MKAGMRSRTISQPLAHQTSRPAAKAMPSATGEGSPARAVSTVAMPLSRASPLPTERSICPGRMTSSMPIARVAVMDSSVMSRERFRESTNFGSTTAKNAVTPSSARPMEKSR